MFKIAVQTGGVEERFGIKECYKIIKEAGFDAADANIDHLFSYADIVAKRIPKHFLGSEKDLFEACKPWKEGAETYGVENYQAHAPFPSYIAGGDEEYNKKLVEMLKSTIRAADYIGCRNLIVHPFFTAYSEHMTPEREWELNIDHYSALIPTAKEYGVTICLENMFSGGPGGKIYSACCSDIDLACKYIDTLNDIAGVRQFGFCLDTGHLLIVGKDIKDTMVKLGNRITAFHVHDNDGMHDHHIAPYMGILDWERFIEGLKAIKFDKTLSFETFNVINKYGTDLALDALKLIAATGRDFARKASE
ncbi:MAG: sugar phosphate isomerase/epimerase [Clostridia bacterium]|nr:sugar phosphate isomerase/epimerase [Clostridia bacterium]